MKVLTKYSIGQKITGKTISDKKRTFIIKFISVVITRGKITELYSDGKHYTDSIEVEYDIKTPS